MKRSELLKKAKSVLAKKKKMKLSITALEGLDTFV